MAREKHDFRKLARYFYFSEFNCRPDAETWRGRDTLSAVIPGRAKHEPGIHFAACGAAQWIPGSPRCARRPGMTAVEMAGIAPDARQNQICIATPVA
ncbi:hypothetical protein [Bradyrhizobium sp. STM 3809]|uniref:hypothetical protein n=1 Tax=Bradyrhizobium sp. STM 3809 TaxID=551936 RepID=UPI0002EAF6AA|nr:hypothetical protein [Bradyrhizobium sp. STM 3809]